MIEGEKRRSKIYFKGKVSKVIKELEKYGVVVYKKRTGKIQFIQGGKTITFIAYNARDVDI